MFETEQVIMQQFFKRSTVSSLKIELIRRCLRLAVLLILSSARRLVSFLFLATILPESARRIFLNGFAGAVFAAGVSGCMAVQPINAPEDTDGFAVAIAGYGRPEDGFRLEIDNPAKTAAVAKRLNAMSGKRRYRHSGALDANSAEIAFYRNGE